jgi:hypothetical protein
MLTLEEQLNVICDELANTMVQRYLSDATPAGRGIQLLPLEKVAIVIKGEKLTTDAGQEVCYALGQEEARRFYTGAIVMNGSANTGRLGWMQYKFDQVSWKSINPTLRTKPDMFQIWHAIQYIGICANQSQISRIQDILDSKCPNCQQVRETSQHPNCCPDHGQTLLF